MFPFLQHDWKTSYHFSEHSYLQALLRHARVYPRLSVDATVAMKTRVLHVKPSTPTQRMSSNQRRLYSASQSIGLPPSFSLIFSSHSISNMRQ